MRFSYSIWKYINVAGVLYCYPKCNATVTSKSDNKTSKQQICSVCGEQVELHDKLTTNEAIYHTNCFKCHKCGRTLNVWKYRLDDGKLYCERQCLEVGDTSEMTSISNTKPTECCLVCGKSVAVPDRVTRFENVFHSNCLKCYRCNRPLNLWKYKIQNEKACCDPCCMRSSMDKKETTIIEDGVQCLTCNKPTDTVERVEIQGQFYHPLCFKCTECNRVLNIWRVKLVNGKPHCDPVCQKQAEVKREF
ncbi:hypothetical protein EG68_10478 [Paragonimus skrjabini miyazakii]|uniref:LIM zinc-binding domain-containing protein n=1 Tax=Paragonimus skrjabini miyazakii TaxID=59628 RepID=A0A8S9YCU7_9TREM|nr:hypothetical protein EG68_10478 [Paragonimus skrjabini miyazakii]